MSTPLVPEVLRERVRRSLADFDSNNDRAGFVAGRPGYRSDLPSDIGSQPAVLRLLLMDVLGLNNLGHFEKTAWEYTFSYRGVRAGIADRKMGVSLYLDREALIDAQAAREMRRAVVADLRGGLGIVESEFLADYARTQLKNGHVTVLNQARRLRGMYEYFAAGAELAYSGGGRLPERTTSGGWMLFNPVTEGYYNSVAMVAAYFSWLEHVLVLGFPFSGPIERQPSVSTFLRLRWYEKFTGVFDNVGSPTVASVYKGLREVASRFRNTYLHGDVSPVSGTIGFHLPGCGAVSMTLSEPEHTPSLYLVPFDQRGYRFAQRRFSAADRLLRTDRRSRYGLLWAESGLDVQYDRETRLEYVTACQSKLAFAKHIEDTGLAWERAVNMDS